MALTDLREAPSGATACSNQTHSTLIAQFREKQFHCRAGQRGHHLLKFRDGAASSLAATQMLNEELLVLLPIETALTGVRTAASHRSVEPSTQDMAGAPPSPDRLYYPHTEKSG